MAKTDAFLKIDNVESESTDDKYKGWIEVESWSWGATQTGSAGAGGGQGSGKVARQDFHFTKKLDKSSPVLFQNTNLGTHLKKIDFVTRKATGTGGQAEYFKVCLEDAIISSYQVGGTGADGVIPVEQVSINFAKMEMIYKEQKADGSLGGEVKQKYDYAANKKI